MEEHTALFIPRSQTARLRGVPTLSDGLIAKTSPYNIILIGTSLVSRSQ